MQETRLHRTETRSWEGCQEFWERLGCVWEPDNWQQEAWMTVRLLKSFSVAEMCFSFQDLVIGTSNENKLWNKRLRMALSCTTVVTHPTQWHFTFLYKCMLYVTIFETARNESRISRSAGCFSPLWLKMVLGMRLEVSRVLYMISDSCTTCTINLVAVHIN